jgi:hypothetical protein
LAGIRYGRRRNSVAYGLRTISTPISTTAFRWIVLVAFALASSFGAWRESYLSSRRFEGELIKTRTEIETLKTQRASIPTVSVNVPATVVNVTTPAVKQRATITFEDPVIRAQIGEPLAVSMHCRNKGDVPAMRVYCGSQFYLEPVGSIAASGDTKAFQEQLYSSFEKAIQPIPKPSDRQSVGKDETQWGTSFWATPFTATDETPLDTGALILVSMGLMLYADDLGDHRIEFCRWLQPPLSAKDRVWHGCRVHNGIQY